MTPYVHPPQEAAADLATRFPLPCDPDAAARALAQRRDEFVRAAARGGSREDFRRGPASLDALQAALEILSPPLTAPKSSRAAIHLIR